MNSAFFTKLLASARQPSRIEEDLEVPMMVYLFSPCVHDVVKPSAKHDDVSVSLSDPVSFVGEAGKILPGY